MRFIIHVPFGSTALIFKMICINLLAKAKLLTENSLFSLNLACLEIIVFWNENNMPCAIGMQLICGVWLSVCICTSHLSSSNPPSQKTTLIKPWYHSSGLETAEQTSLDVAVDGWLCVNFMGTAAILMHVREIGRWVDLGQARVCIFPKIVFGFHKSSTAFNNLSFVSLRNLGVLDLLQNKFLWSFSFSNTCGTPRPGRGSRGAGGIQMCICDHGAKAALESVGNTSREGGVWIRDLGQPPPELQDTWDAAAVGFNFVQFGVFCSCV